jgi:hypothetical protein
VRFDIINETKKIILISADKEIINRKEYIIENRIRYPQYKYKCRGEWTDPCSQMYSDHTPELLVLFGEAHEIRDHSFNAAFWYDSWHSDCAVDGVYEVMLVIPTYRIVGDDLVKADPIEVGPITIDTKLRPKVDAEQSSEVPQPTATEN